MYSLEIIPDIIIDKIKSYVIFTPDNEELKEAMAAYTDDHRTLINGFKRKK